ncbi:hypothetical protein JCM14469_11450 [Desulfatiferula olefinivorans]
MPIPAPMKKNDNVWFRQSEQSHGTHVDSVRGLYRDLSMDQRDMPREKVDDGVYAVIDSYAPQICTITNMSEAGLSYVYFKGDEPAFESLTMDVLATGFGFCLERIPFKKVADYPAETTGSGGRLEKRVACIEFVDLSDSQVEQVRAFIDNHVKRTVN